MKWIDANEYVERVSMIQDPQLRPRPKEEIEAVINAKKSNLVYIPKKPSKSLIYYKDKMVKHSLNNIGTKFRIQEIIDNSMILRKHEYRRVYEMARNHLENEGYELIKPKKGWYICKKIN